MRWCLHACVLVLFVLAPGQSPPPDWIYVNGMIWTGVPSTPGAHAMAVKDGRLTAVGTDADIRALAGASTRIVDLEGMRVVPGFNDAHWHLPSRRSVNLAEAGRVEEIVARLEAFAATLPAGAWVTGRGWTPDNFPGNLPHRRYLDEAFPDRPLLLTDRDGHMALVNGRALALAAVTGDTPSPEGGRIERGPDGAPTGLLKESATALVERLVPPPSPEDIDGALRAELAAAASFGLTSLQVASGSASGSRFDAWQRARAQGILTQRVRAAVPFERDVTPARLSEFVALRDGHRDGLLSYGIAKGMLDGTIDGRTAAMLEPYANSDDFGLPMWTTAALDAAVTAYDRAGIQIELHAIGDRAIRMALDAFERAARVNGTSGRRHRVEHVEVPDPADLPRFRALGVIASTQAIFATPDAATLTNYVPALGPARAARAMPFKALDDAGAVQAFGSDYPVFPMDPLLGMHAAVTRQLPDGSPAGGWQPQHRISVEAALRHYTRDAAYASFEEQEKGTLTPGKWADFVVLSEDILDGDATRLLTARVVRTVMGGRQTYSARADDVKPAVRK